MDQEAIAQGLGLILQNADRNGLVSQAGSHSRGASYRLLHLQDIICPVCGAHGTLAKLQLSQLHDVSVDIFHAPDAEAETQDLMFMLDKLCFMRHEFNPAGPDHEDSSVSIANQDLVKQMQTPWLCFSCLRHIEPEKFVGQLKREKV